MPIYSPANGIGFRSAVRPRSGNLLNRNQASVEVDVSGWTTNNAATTIARSTTFALDGAASLRLTRTSTTGDAVSRPAVSSVATFFPVTAGKTYLSSAWYRADTTSRTVWAFIQWYDAADAFLGQHFASVTDNSTGWTQVTVLGLAPAGATKAHPVLVVTGCLAGEFHYADVIELLG